MKYKIIAVTLIISVAGVLTYYFSNHKTVSQIDKQEINQALEEEGNIIVYTNEGFEPKEIKINKGEIVRFINISDRKMWVASNDHPTHNIYPEFDQKDIVTRNGIYEFKFDKTGKWGFHNHLFSSHLGTVEVIEN